MKWQHGLKAEHASHTRPPALRNESYLTPARASPALRLSGWAGRTAPHPEPLQKCEKREIQTTDVCVRPHSLSSTVFVPSSTYNKIPHAFSRGRGVLNLYFLWSTVLTLATALSSTALFLNITKNISIHFTALLFEDYNCLIPRTTYSLF